jgi:amino acid permease
MSTVLGVNLYPDSPATTVTTHMADGEGELGHDKTVLHTDPVASVQTTAINIISNVVGAGILSVPSAVAAMSVIPGLVVLSLFAAMSAYSMLLLTICAQRTGRFTYKDLIEYAFQSAAYGRLFDGAIFIYTFACLIAYAKAIGDSMSPVMHYLLGHTNLATSHGFWILMAAVVFFPLSSMKQLAELRFTSLFGFLVIVYMVFVIAIYFFHEKSATGGLVNADTPWFEFGMDFLRSAPICSVAFSCHYNVPVFYGEMKRRSPQKMMRAVSFAMPVIFSIYVVTAVFSVLHFPKEALKKEGDISLNFPDSYIPMTIGRIGLFIHFVCVYPIICIACRRALNSIVFNRGNMSRKVYIVEAFFLVAVTCVLAWQVQSVSQVFQFNGALFGISIVVVIPNVLYLKIIPQTDDESSLADEDKAIIIATQDLTESAAQSRRESVNSSATEEPADGAFGFLSRLTRRRSAKMAMAARVLIVFGLLLSVTALTMDIIKAASKEHDNNGAAPAVPAHHANETTTEVPPPTHLTPTPNSTLELFERFATGFA